MATESNLEVFSGDSWVLEFTISQDDGTLMDLTEFEGVWALALNSSPIISRIEAIIDPDQNNNTGLLSITVDPGVTATIPARVYSHELRLTGGSPEQTRTVSFGSLSVRASIL